MEILRYNEWTDTALTIHLVTQMVGKVKLARMEPQPEWNHIVLSLTHNGFTTGLIPNGDRSFCINVDLRSGTVAADGVHGRSSGFAFRPGASVSQYYDEFRTMLAAMLCDTEIYSVPMEMPITTPFEHMTEARDYDPRHAMTFFRMCTFAHNALLRFVSPFRGKKMLPSYFWGTFDVTSILFGGQARPFTGHGIIEQVAFDEQMMEFGFWPGDGGVEEPSFFILPYPFVTADIGSEPIRPDKAFYKKEKGEFFLTLRDACSYPDPEQAVVDFCTSGYKILTRTEGWRNLEWLNKPLLASKGSNVLRRQPRR